MNDQKKKEFKSLKILLDILEFDKAEEIIPEEPPDFIINLGNSKLGVEVVEIFQPPPGDGIYLQQQESIKENIVDNTRDLLREEEMPPLDLSINFNDHFRLNVDSSPFVLEKSDQYDFPPVLRDIALENIPEIDQKREIYSTSCKQLPIKINSITIYRADYMKIIDVTTSKGGILPPLDKETLKETIDSKDEKVEKYKNKCDDCWLLIVSNDIHFEKAFDLKNSKKAFEECYEFDFEKVYLLEECFGELFEIQPCT